MKKFGKFIFFIILVVIVYFVWSSFLSPTSIACREGCSNSGYAGGKCRTEASCEDYGEISLSGDYCIKGTDEDLSEISRKVCCCKEQGGEERG